MARNGRCGSAQRLPASAMAKVSVAHAASPKLSWHTWPAALAKHGEVELGHHEVLELGAERELVGDAIVEQHRELLAGGRVGGEQVGRERDRRADELRSDRDALAARRDGVGVGDQHRRAGVGRGESVDAAGRPSIVPSTGSRRPASAAARSPRRRRPGRRRRSRDCSSCRCRARTRERLAASPNWVWAPPTLGATPKNSEPSAWPEMRAILALPVIFWCPSRSRRESCTARRAPWWWSGR